MQLRAAVAAGGPKDVAGQAFGVDTHHYRLLGTDLTLDQGHMLLPVNIVLVGNQAEFARVEGGQPGLGGAAHQHVLAQPVGDQVGDGSNL